MASFAFSVFRVFFLPFWDPNGVSGHLEKKCRSSVTLADRDGACNIMVQETWGDVYIYILLVCLRTPVVFPSL